MYKERLQDSWRILELFKSYSLELKLILEFTERHFTEIVVSDRKLSEFPGNALSSTALIGRINRAINRDDKSDDKSGGSTGQSIGKVNRTINRAINRTIKRALSINYYHRSIYPS